MGLRTILITGGLMSNFNAFSVNTANSLGLPESNLGMLPARLTKRLWGDPQEFLQTTNARQIAEWAIFASKLFIVALPAPLRRGPKQVYHDSSILMLAYIQVAWQMGYEMVADYFRAHPAAAQAARWKGMIAAWQHTALVYSVMLGVALTAHRFQRPELAGSRMKVLAIHAPA